MNHIKRRNLLANLPMSLKNNHFSPEKKTTCGLAEP